MMKIGIGIGIGHAQWVGTAVPFDPLTAYPALNGGPIAYEHPDPPGYISEARGTLADTSGMVAQTNPTGAISITSAGIVFPGSASSQTVRVSLEDGAAITAGTPLRVTGEVFNRLDPGNSAALRPRFFSSQNVGPNTWTRAGEFSFDYTLATTIPASPSTNRYIELVVTNSAAGGLSVRNLSVTTVPVGLRRAHIAAGQSNMACNEAGPSTDLTLDRGHPRLEQRPNFTFNAAWVADGVRKRLTAPVVMSSNILGITPALAYMREHIKGNTDQNVLLANALGGTSLVATDGAWKVGGSNPTMLNQLTADITAFLAESVDNVIEAVLWCQGESDRGSSADTTYPPAFLALVEYIRGLDARLADLPFIVFSLNPYATDDPVNQALMIATQATLDQDSGSPNAIPGVYYMPYDAAWGDQSVTGLGDGDVHMNTPINRVRGITARQSAALRMVYGAASFAMIGQAILGTNLGVA